MPAYKPLNTAFIWECIAGFNKAGLLKARPTSLDTCETFTPPRADNCGVPGTLRKLKTELPLRVWAANCKETIEMIIRTHIRMAQFQILNLKFKIKYKT